MFNVMSSLAVILPSWGGCHRGSDSPSDRDPALPPSPSSPNNILATPEPTSISSSSRQGHNPRSPLRMPNGGGFETRAFKLVMPVEGQSSSSQTSSEKMDPENSPFRSYMSPIGASGMSHNNDIGNEISGPHSVPSPDMVPPVADPTSPQRKQARKPKDIFRKQGNDSLVVVLSAMYAKLVVVMGIGFPLAEVISPYIPPSFFVGFYLYLYGGSILFLVYAYSFLLRNENANMDTLPRFTRNSKNKKDTSAPADAITEISTTSSLIRRKKVEDNAGHCGSFYLRMGAVAFGIGSMIYSGLEFGQFFELDPLSKCFSIEIAVTPCIQMAFTFFQLYFIFLNSKMCIYKFKKLARFGLMHMVATNLCVWLHVLVQETKHEILTFIDPKHTHHSLVHQHSEAVPNGVEDSVLMVKDPFTVNTTENDETFLNNVMDIVDEADETSHSRVTRGLRHTQLGRACRRVNIMGQLVQDVSPFLFPCTIEYSLICAAILYIMWKNIGRPLRMRHNSCSSDLSTIPATTRKHHYSVDCAHAHKGLFTGILVLVLAIISLILFFVLINRPQYKELAVFEAHISELVLYCLNTIAACIALFQIRELRYNPYHNVELDNILLIVAQTGVYLFAVFCIIGGHFTMDSNTILGLLTALANLIQASVQTIFILDASRRHAQTAEQVRKKPGRELVTFLLVCNFAMWAINSLETRRADSNPVQINFYGFWAWTIIAHISTPLAIFFRFHSTVCLCEIWKKLYKLKVDHV